MREPYRVSWGNTGMTSRRLNVHANVNVPFLSCTECGKGFTMFNHVIAYVVLEHRFTVTEKNFNSRTAFIDKQSESVLAILLQQKVCKAFSTLGATGFFVETEREDNASSRFEAILDQRFDG